jgi:hypothetical protein
MIHIVYLPIHSFPFVMQRLLFQNIRRSFRPACASDLRLHSLTELADIIVIHNKVLVVVGIVAAVALSRVTLRSGLRMMIT